MARTREEISAEDKWNVEAIYENDALWEKVYSELKQNIHRITSYKGTLANSAVTLQEFIEVTIEIEREMGKLATYASMKHDEDTRVEQYLNYRNQNEDLQAEYRELSAWVTPELMAIEDSRMEEFLASVELAPHRFHLESILRLKPHILSEPEERLLSMASKIFDVPEDAFKALSDADLRFGNILKGDTSIEITHGQYYVLLIDPDRNIRQQAFQQYLSKYNEFATTMASLLYSEVKTHVFNARARNYQSTLDAVLVDKKIEPAVYTNLISAVHDRIGSLHNYLAYRKEKMGLDELHLYDVYVPFIEIPQLTIPFEEAKEDLIAAVTPLGEEYQSILQTGLNTERWVDIYECENKRSGAYSTGSYDTLPYILMNYNGTLNTARTLAHEAGHSMHSYFTHKNQPPIYGDYPIFLAEVASTFNEELFSHHLLEQTTDSQFKAYLLNSQLEEIRTTLFRQTMFAEFELMVHQLVETDQPLSAQLLKREYRKLNELYFGDGVVIDPEIDIEWARIPHFYYNYYVYQYATGISAAIALFQRVINGEVQEREDYLGFLKAGCSKYPIEILQDAGIDMHTPAPIHAAIDYFDAILKELQELDNN